MNMTDDRHYDVIVVGAGPAGLTAAIMLARARWRVVVISKESRRNSMATNVSNVPYADGVSPGQIYAKMEDDALRYGVTILWDEVVAINTDSEYVAVSRRANPDLRGRRLLLATGRVDDLPPWLPDGVWGKSAFDCPYCHIYERRDGVFACIGKGDETLKMAAVARRLAGSMTVVLSDESACGGRLARLLVRHQVTVHHGTITQASCDTAGRITLSNADGQTLEADTLLLGDVVRPYRRLVEALDLDLTREGFPETTLYGVTSNPLVYSAGNVEGSPYFIWTGAASSGINAARAICEDLAFSSELLED
jgi:thioredoxin reductase